MIDPGDSFQVGLAATLLAASTVTDLVGENVLDPLSAAGAPYDFVEIGDDQVLNVATTCGDLSEIFATIHVWTAGVAALRKAKQIGGAIRDALAEPFALEGHTMTSIVFHTATYRTEADPTNDGGLIGHGIIVFHVQTKPTP